MLSSSISTAVSKGVSANMLKAGTKRRRTKQQIKEEKARVLLEEVENNRKLAELAELQARVGMLAHPASQGKAASEILSQMISSGIAAQAEDSSVIVNAANGEHRFGVNPAPADEGGQ